MQKQFKLRCRSAAGDCFAFAPNILTSRWTSEHFSDPALGNAAGASPESVSCKCHMTMDRNKATYLSFGLLALLLIFLDLGVVAGQVVRIYALIVFLIISGGLFFFWTIQAFRTKNYNLFLKILTTPILICSAHFVLNFYRIKMDGLRAEIFALTFGENSVYSNGYSHKQFSELRPGMTKDIVISKIGEPTWKVPFARNSGAIGDTTTYYYCTDGQDTHHRVRVVLIHADTVKAIGHSFYYD